MDNDYLDDEIMVKSKEENEKRIDDAPTLADKLIVAMSCIEERLTEVRKISAVIENVSSQSGMLALNAAVEATHAGEYGRGFSVIASEIRELSAKCKQEAKTTDELIDYILLSVERGNKVVGFTVDSVRNISSSLSDVENTLSQISSVIEGTAATAEEFAASSEELSAQAEVLKELSAGFTVQQPDDILTEQSTTNKMGEKLL
jgi:methyl-accepting chemotaxis protein